MTETTKGTRGRKALPPAEVVDAHVNHEALARAGAAATELVLHDEEVAQNVRAVAHQLHYTGPLDPDLLEMGIREQQQRGVHAVLAIGAMLLLLREQCPHGEFLQRVERLGIEERLSRRFMQASKKFSDAEPKLLDAIGSQSKFFELLVLDNEELDELKTTGSVRGITLDKFAKMTVSDARRTLRDQAATLKAKDAVIANQAEKINEQAEQLALLASAKPDERQREQLALLAEAMEKADNALVSAIRVAAGAVQKAATGMVELQAQQSINVLMQRFVDACVNDGFGIDLAAEVDPLWLMEWKKQAAAGLDIEAQKRATRKALGRGAQS